MIGLFAALTTLAMVVADTEPTQVHIALAGNDGNGNSNGMAVSWETDDDTSVSYVNFGKISGEYTVMVSGSSTAYYETFHHHCVLTSLEPSTTYYYTVGDTVTVSEEFQFVTAPLSETFEGNFTFSVFGDLGVTNGDSALGYIDEHHDEYDLIWHAGDISYADDSFLHKGCVFNFCYEQVWDEYMNMAQDWASNKPYMTAPGNHEADCHDPSCLTDTDRQEKLSNFTAYNTRFRMPSPETGGAMNMHYSFNYGPVHFISLDTETGYPGAAEETRYIFPCGGFQDQISWLENDLKQAAIDRESGLRPWILAAGHHPMYQGDNVNEDFQAAMEDLFHEYGVDMYFSGHVHSYERDFPVYQSVVDPNGYNFPTSTAYAMIGGAGNDEMRGVEDNSTFVTPKSAVHPSSPEEYRSRHSESDGKWRASTGDGEWTAVTDTEYFGVGKVTIMDSENMLFEYIRTTSGEVYDSVVLKKHH